MHHIVHRVRTSVRPLVAAGLAALLTACATPLTPPITGYTCCNLRDYGGWISSNNVQGGTLVPAGTPISLTSIKRDYYVYGSLGDRGIGLRDDQAKRPAQTLAWLRDVVVSQSPRDQIAAMPAEIRAAIDTGRIQPGMTRQQVLLSLGYPARADTPDLASPVWRYWTALTDETVDVRFDAAGQVVDIAGKPTAVRVVQVQR